MKTIKLKKYPNRKLYAPKGQLSGKARYVNHQQIAELIKAGNTIEVTTSSKGEDVTDSVLKEILTNTALSTETIYGLIRG